jgi:hypothetical protein
MTSFRQIEANRRNALNSTGPRTQEGKKRSRRNALRHGLTAETVLEVLEDPADYKAFEMSVTADFDAQTAVERELVLRLASLLWRLRRAIAVETGLLHMHVESEAHKEGRPLPQPDFREAIVRLGEVPDGNRLNWSRREDDEVGSTIPPYRNNLELAGCFLHLSNVDNGAFDLLHRYETALWRQVGQILITLDALQRKTPLRTRPFSRSIHKLGNNNSSRREPGRF